MSRRPRTDAEALTRARKKGVPTSEQMREIAQRRMANTEGPAHRDDPDNDNMWPHYTYPSHPQQDLRHRLTQQLLDQRNGMGYRKMLTDEDIEYVKQMQEEEEGVAFRHWISTQFDLKDPLKADLVAKLFPEVFTDQEKFVQSRLKAAYQWIMLNIRGPRSREDFEFIWMVENGNITIPTGFKADELGLAMPNPFRTRNVEPAWRWGPFSLFRFIGSDKDAPEGGFRTTNQQSVRTQPNSHSNDVRNYRVLPDGQGGYQSLVGNVGGRNYGDNNLANAYNGIDWLGVGPARGQPHSWWGR